MQDPLGFAQLLQSTAASVLRERLLRQGGVAVRPSRAMELLATLTPPSTDELAVILGTAMHELLLRPVHQQLWHPSATH